MKALLILAWFLACSVPAVPGSLLDLRSMIKTVTGKDAFMTYGFYGCYCGWGGRGTPIDGTDWCCFEHDHCYEQLEEEGCHIRTQPYRYSFTQGHVICEPGSFCQMKLCICDKKFAYCLKRNLVTYNHRYRFIHDMFCK